MQPSCFVTNGKGELMQTSKNHFEAKVIFNDETIRRMFLVQLRPAQEVKREKVAKETGTSAPDKSQVKRAPVRKEHKVGPNDPCPCGSGKKYKKCCMQKDKLES